MFTTLKKSLRFLSLIGLMTMGWFFAIADSQAVCQCKCEIGRRNPIDKEGSYDSPHACDVACKQEFGPYSSVDSCNPI